jgi:Zn-dependent protease
VPFGFNAITPQLIIAVALILLVSFPVHEFSHALAAYRLGDSTAKLFGRLTLNPIAHFDPFGALMLVISALVGTGIGWAKPTPVNTANLRYGAVGDALVSFAGPVSNLIMAAVVALPLRFILHSDLVAQVPLIALEVMAVFVTINVSLFIFNLIPVPPLDGSHILLAALDPRTAYQLRPVLMQYGPILLLILIITGVASRVMFPIIGRIVNLLVGVDLLGV